MIIAHFTQTAIQRDFEWELLDLEHSLLLFFMDVGGVCIFLQVLLGLLMTFTMAIDLQ